MEILQLRYFCDAAETERFSKTAKNFGVPASDISQTVSRLEKEMGISFFDRTANRVALNENGRVFYKRIKKALDLIDEAKLVFEDTRGEVSGEIRLNIETNRRVITEVIESFKEKYPQVSFVINHDIHSDDKFDFIISDSHIGNFSKALIVKERILLAANRESEVIKNNISDVQSLADERFITMLCGSSMHRITESICEKSGFTPNITIQSDDPYYIRKYVSMGLGIAFIPEMSWKGLMSDDVVCRDICGIIRETYVFWDDSRYMTKASREFLKLLLQKNI